MMPLRWAVATMCARLVAPSLRPMRVRWFFTVNADSVNCRPMSLLLCPSARRVRI